MTCQSTQAAWLHTQPFLNCGLALFCGPHRAGTTNKETTFLRIGLCLFDFFMPLVVSFLRLHYHPCFLHLLFPIWKWVVSAKCKGAVKSNPGGGGGGERERERERESQWVHLGSFPMMQEKAWPSFVPNALLRSDPNDKHTQTVIFSSYQTYMSSTSRDWSWIRGKTYLSDWRIIMNV